jgi:YHS domain-containing protein
MKAWVRLLSFVGLVAGLGLSTASWSAAPINTLKPGLFGGHTDTAVQGYDTVAYFTDGKPVKGDPKFQTEWMGAKWQFANQQHLDLFKAEPTKYAPQYGGYCAYGVSRDYLVKIDPEAWSIIDGKLYLNYDADVQKKWAADPQGFIKTADGKFSDLLKKD